MHSLIFNLLNRSSVPLHSVIEWPRCIYATCAVVLLPRNGMRRLCHFSAEDYFDDEIWHWNISWDSTSKSNLKSALHKVVAHWILKVLLKLCLTFICFWVSFIYFHNFEDINGKPSWTFENEWCFFQVDRIAMLLILLNYALH